MKFHHSNFHDLDNIFKEIWIYPMDNHDNGNIMIHGYIMIYHDNGYNQWIYPKIHGNIMIIYWKHESFPPMFAISERPRMVCTTHCTGNFASTA